MSAKGSFRSGELVEYRRDSAPPETGVVVRSNPAYMFVQFNDGGGPKAVRRDNLWKVRNG